MAPLYHLTAHNPPATGLFIFWKKRGQKKKKKKQIMLPSDWYIETMIRISFAAGRRRKQIQLTSRVTRRNVILHIILFVYTSPPFWKTGALLGGRRYRGGNFDTNKAWLTQFIQNWKKLFFFFSLNSTHTIFSPLLISQYSLLLLTFFSLETNRLCSFYGISR